MIECQISQWSLTWLECGSFNSSSNQNRYHSIVRRLCRRAVTFCLDSFSWQLLSPYIFPLTDNSRFVLSSIKLEYSSWRQSADSIRTLRASIFDKNHTEVINTFSRSDERIMQKMITARSCVIFFVSAEQLAVISCYRSHLNAPPRTPSSIPSSTRTSSRSNIKTQFSPSSDRDSGEPLLSLFNRKSEKKCEHQIYSS